jgi:hypothetical protein
MSGATTLVRIFVGARGGALAAPSGPADAARDVPDDPSAPPRPLPLRGFGGAYAGSGGGPATAAYALSFSPSQQRANQRPPATPRTSRTTGRQRRTCARVRSSTSGGAAPAASFGGGRTENGRAGAGYKGRGAPASAAATSSSGAGERWRASGSASGYVGPARGEECAVPE